jgi:hypothetical protein
MPFTNGSGTQAQEAPVTQPNDSPVTLEAFLQGQQEINGRFCQVDWEVLQAIIELKNAVGAVLKIDLNSVNAAIEKAEASSSLIPGVFPPGCKRE